MRLLFIIGPILTPDRARVLLRPIHPINDEIKFSTLNGPAVQNKGMALSPRRIVFRSTSC